MKKTNRDYANDIEDALRDGLMDSVLSEYTEEYGGSYWNKVEELTKKQFDQKKLEYVKTQLDTSNLLHLIKLNARLFERQKQQEPRLIDYTIELTELRNGNSHNSMENEASLSDDVLEKRAFQATRLLEAFDTKESRQAADITRRIRETFLARIEGEIDDKQAIPDEQKPAKAPASAVFEDEYNTVQEPAIVEGIKESHPSIYIKARDKPEHQQPKPIRSERSKRMKTDKYHDPDLAQLTQEESAVSESQRSGGQKHRKRFSLINFTPTFINSPIISPTITSNPNINPSIQQNASQNLGVGSASAAEEFNKTAFAVGLITGLFGMMGGGSFAERKSPNGYPHAVSRNCRLFGVHRSNWCNTHRHSRRTGIPRARHTFSDNLQACGHGGKKEKGLRLSPATSDL